MRSVTRPAMPASLRRNAVRWKRELENALSSECPNSSKIRRCFDRYRQQDIRTALEDMYSGLCCYCESRVGIVDFPHIEHRQPKTCFPKLTFEWDNLHLACQVCNQAKGKNWDECYPILDSVVDPISKHLSYRVGGGWAKRWPESKQGRTTICHAGLNRQKLLDARTRVSLRAMKVIDVLNRDPSSPSAELLREELECKTAGEYGSLMSWLLDNGL